MAKHSWLQRFPGAVTVCDPNGIVLEMNDQAARTFEKDGGYALVGQNMFECHSSNSQQTLRTLMEQQQANVYTIEKNGVKKLIYQTPWYDEDGAYGGFVEVSLVLPENMPHFIRG
jgi:transcriptional regulator with PAS, ATPase and Fis domain